MNSIVVLSRQRRKRRRNREMAKDITPTLYLDDIVLFAEVITNKCSKQQILCNEQNLHSYSLP